MIDLRVALSTKACSTAPCHCNSETVQWERHGERESEREGGGGGGGSCSLASVMWARLLLETEHTATALPTKKPGDRFCSKD